MFVPQPNYRTTDVCDCCTLPAPGTMFPMVQALIGPLFLCDACLSEQGGTIMRAAEFQYGAPVAHAQDENYRTRDNCDGCDKIAVGTMFHAAGATGRICPVLFLCDACAAPVDAQAAA